MKVKLIFLLGEELGLDLQKFLSIRRFRKMSNGV